MKTKNVDVVVTREGIAPVLAVSCKGVTGAFRNLTNRMEETIGECTNLHITYPALVLGYLVLLRANRMIEAALDDAAEAAVDAEQAGEGAKTLAANDIAMTEGGEPVAGIVRFHNALRELVGRRGIRDDVSRYEAIGFGLVEMHGPGRNSLLDSFPLSDSPLRLSGFFDTLYARYDERFVVSAPDLSRTTGDWSGIPPHRRFKCRIWTMRHGWVERSRQPRVLIKIPTAEKNMNGCFPQPRMPALVIAAMRPDGGKRSLIFKSQSYR